MLAFAMRGSSRNCVAPQKQAFVLLFYIYRLKRFRRCAAISVKKTNSSDFSSQAQTKNAAAPTPMVGISTHSCA